MELEEIVRNLQDLISGFDYEKEVKYAEKVSVHSQGRFYDFLLIKHLHEDIDTLNWRKANWVAVSKTGFNRAFNTLSRIFRDSQFSVTTSDVLKDYLSVERFKEVNFFTYASTYLMRDMIEDPNSVIAVLPIIDNVRNPNERIRVKIINIPSENIRYFDGETLIWCDGKKDYSNKLNWNQDNEYKVLTPYAYLKLHKVSSKKYKEEIIYTHNLQFLPAFIAGGDWDRCGFYRSFFDGYLDFATEALKQYSDYQFVTSKSAYPIREIADMDCSEPDCERGRVYDVDRDGLKLDTWHNCRACKGTGKVIALAPSKILIRPAVMGNADAIDDRPLIQDHAPPTDILNFMQQGWELSLKKAEEALQLNFVDAAQSGVAKAMDRDEHRAFLMRISINYYDRIIYNCLWAIECYINPNIREQPTVIRPVDFNINTEQSLETEVKEFTAAGITNLAAASMDKLFPKKSGGDMVLLKTFEFIRWFDPLYAQSLDQKRADFISESIQEKTYYNSIFVKNALDKLVYKIGKKDFLDLDFVQIEKLITPILEDMYPETKEVEEEEIEETETINQTIT